MDTILQKIFKDIKLSDAHIRTIEEVMETGRITLTPSEDHILEIGIDKDIAYDLYCDDFIEDNDGVTSVNTMNVLYEYENAYDKAYKYAEIHNRRVRESRFNGITEHITALVCYLCMKMNEYKYSKLKQVQDVTEPVPFQVFRKLVLDSKEPIKVCVEDKGMMIAGELDDIIINKGMMGVKIYAVLCILSKSSEDYVLDKQYVQIYPEAFVKDLSGLGLIDLENNATLKEILTQRGRKYVEYTKEVKYCHCTGFGVSDGGWIGDIRHSIDSRIMIDINAFKLLNSNIDSSWYVGNAGFSKNIIGKTIGEDSLWMCSPVVYGFSFDNKEWCRMEISDVREIEFSANAFEDLMIPQINKDMFTASLTHEMPSLDAISNKGAGKIFLLYGAPGVGKTMTAESVAELLQKPLYFVSVGELGTNPRDLEFSLDRVMKVAQSWDAVVLLDEVDVFAINRLGASIERNAMTAIFLRMLERYSGVMFMTTNLKDNLDPAFISRATAVIEYKGLNKSERENIWNNVINKAAALNQITIDESVYDFVSEFAEIDINGRVIKNSIRLAYTLALSTEDKVMKVDHIKSALAVRG